MAWAIAAKNVIHIPTLQSTLWGTVLAAASLGIMIWGMLSLWIFGGGLPMNAFPPQRFVGRGAYALIPHPIYGGFILICSGVSIYFGSASGLWLVTPAVALGCAALVLGYELPDLRWRFGRQVAPRAMADDALAPSAAQRMRVAITVLAPWLAAYGLIWLMGRQAGAISTYLPFENHIPIVEWTELIYASTYVVVILTPFLVRNRDGLRKFMRLGIGASVLLFSLYLLLPIFVPPRPIFADHSDWPAFTAGAHALFRSGRVSLVSCGVGIDYGVCAGKRWTSEARAVAGVGRAGGSELRDDRNAFDSRCDLRCCGVSDCAEDGRLLERASEVGGVGGELMAGAAHWSHANHQPWRVRSAGGVYRCIYVRRIARREV